MSKVWFGLPRGFFRVSYYPAQTEECDGDRLPYDVAYERWEYRFPNGITVQVRYDPDDERVHKQWTLDYVDASWADAKEWPNIPALDDWASKRQMLRDFITIKNWERENDEL